MFSNKEAWHEGYEQGFAAAEEQMNEMIEHLWLDCNSLNAIAGVNLSSKATKCLLSIQAHVIEAIEQITKLTAERDALLADVKDYQGSICCYCKNIVRDNEKKRVYCGCFGDFPTSNGMPLECGRWEWRGLSLASETSDKEVER